LYSYIIINNRSIYTHTNESMQGADTQYIYNWTWLYIKI